jgi:aminoglycoside phosphotransferase (APT) family kinase protein
MLPNPSVFLAALRRELLSPDFFSPERLAQGWSQVIATRGGEVLAHLAARNLRLPTVAAALAARRQALLSSAGATATTASSDPVTQHVLEGSVIAALLANCPDPVVGEAVSIEAEFLRGYEQALEEIRAGAIEATAPEIPTPTAEQIAGLIGPAAVVTNVRRKFGATANELFFFDLEGATDFKGPMVLRRKGELDVTGGRPSDECALLQRLAATGLSAPRALAAGEDDGAGKPFLIMACSPGETIAPAHLRNHPARIRNLARELAKLHSLKPLRAKSSRDAFIETVHSFWNRWRAERDEHWLLLEAGFIWLERNASILEGDASLVHGDFNLRNILFDGGHPTILDWELSHDGHPQEDLSFLKPDIDQVEGWEEFLAAYQEHGGQAYSPEISRYFDIWTCVWRASMSACIYPGYARGQHTSFLYASTQANEFFREMTTLSRLLG